MFEMHLKFISILVLMINSSQVLSDNYDYDLKQDTTGWTDFGDMFEYDVHSKSNDKSTQTAPQDCNCDHKTQSDKSSTASESPEVDTNCEPVLNSLETCRREKEALNQLTQSKTCNHRISTFVSRAVLKFIKKLKTYEDQLNEDQYLQISTYVYANSLPLIEEFVQRNQLDCNRVDEFEDTIYAVIDKIYFVNQSKNTLFYNFIENHGFKCLVTLSIGLTALFLYKLYLMPFFGKCVTIYIVIFVASFAWQWIQLYQLEISKRHLTVSSAPEECINLSNNKEMTISSIFSSYVRSFTSMDTKCQEYYRAVMVDPMFEVNPLAAISHTLSTALFKPISIFGDELGKGLSKFYNYFNYFEKILITIPLLILIAFFLILYMGFNIHFPFFMGSISRGPQMPSTHSGTDFHLMQNLLNNQQIVNSIDFSGRPSRSRDNRLTAKTGNTISDNYSQPLSAQTMRRSKSTTCLSRL